MSANSQGRRRQARGRARIDQILDSAATVFGELGYEATTTNAIAAHAGISPGSLYQFFRSKHDIARALAERYAAALATLELPELTDADATAGAVRDMLDAIVDLNLRHPGFKALFARTDMPAEMRDAVRPVQEQVHRRVGAALATMVPELTEDRADAALEVILGAVRGLMPAIVAADDDGRSRLVSELQRSLVAYVDTLRA